MVAQKDAKNTEHVSNDEEKKETKISSQMKKRFEECFKYQGPSMRLTRKL